MTNKFLAILLLSPWAPQNFWAKTSSCSCQSQIHESIKSIGKAIFNSYNWILDSFRRKVRFLLPTCQISIPLDSVFYLDDMVNMNRSISWDKRFTRLIWSFPLSLWGVAGSWSANVAFVFSAAVAMIHTFQIYDLRPATPTLWQQWLDFRKPKAKSTSRKDLMASKNSKQICCTKLLGSTCCFHCLVIRQSG